MTPDSELLGRYAKTRSEDAFAELVRRHVNLVYSAALRQVNGDAHLAKDVSQTVFTDLARKAASLARGGDASSPKSLTSWLYTSAHFAAAKIVRTENRRRNREDKFMREPANESSAGVSPAQTSPETEWDKIRPALDDAMHELKETDREAILLRYFENRQYTEVGVKLGLNENAARMRVERALEKLRAIFAKRGITAAALASVISANAVQVAPAGLATALTTTSIAAIGTGTTFTLLKFMTATQFKLGLGVLVVAGAATALVVQHQTQTQLRDKSELLRQQIAQLRIDNENLSNRLASVGEAKSLTDEQLNELLQLRGQVGVLRRQTNELENSLAKTQSYLSRRPNSGVQQQPSDLPADYPKTPDAATEGILDALARGDWDTFITNYAEPDVPRNFYDQAFTDEIKSNLVGMEIISIGQPTNWLSNGNINKWFVPYDVRFKDGSEKKFRLSVGQDTSTGRFYFDGGL
jgi:RNA polymerase sigma factor (sigma-70 family)